MDSLLTRLNYKDHQRICIINADDLFIDSIQESVPDIVIDRVIDPRYLYSFFLVFVKSVSDVNEFAPAAIHNLTPDGILWFFYPSNQVKTGKTELSGKSGWDIFKTLGFDSVRYICIDDQLKGIRFRNKNFIKRRR